MALNVATEAALAGAYPAVHLGKREQKIVKILKTYIDAASGESLTAANMALGNSSNVSVNVPLTAAGASRIIGRVLSSVFTVTIAAPGVVTSTAHGLANGDVVSLSTTGALPTGLVVATAYYVVNKATNSFELALTSNGASITTTGTQSGVHTYSASGLAPRALSIGNQDLAAAAAISYSKLASLTSGNILVGSAGAVATSVAMSGDATIIASGALTIASGAVSLDKLAAGVTPSHVVKFAAAAVATAGGDAVETVSITGLLSTDIVQVMPRAVGNTPRTILTAIPSTGVLTITYSGDPSTDHSFDYSVLRAAV